MLYEPIVMPPDMVRPGSPNGMADTARRRRPGFPDRAAAFAHIGFSPASELPMVGASGAISGIMGAYILLYPSAKVRTYFPPFFFFRIRAFFFLLLWFVLQLYQALSAPGGPEEGGVAVWAHIGGFVAGLLLVKLFENPALVARRKAIHDARLLRV